VPNISNRIDRLENVAGFDKKCVAFLVVNPGESEGQTWTRLHPGIPFPSSAERDERYSMFITINLNFP
jgi:hypothetical protein